MNAKVAVVVLALVVAGAVGIPYIALSAGSDNNTDNPEFYFTRLHEILQIVLIGQIQKLSHTDEARDLIYKNEAKSKKLPKFNLR